MVKYNGLKTKKRNTRGLGYLYKRAKGGKEYPATSKVQGKFYLRYKINGKTVKTQLKHSDGSPITSLEDAKKEQARIMAPLQIADEKVRLETLKASIAIA